MLEEPRNETGSPGEAADEYELTVQGRDVIAAVRWLSRAESGHAHAALPAVETPPDSNGAP